MVQSGTKSGTRFSTQSRQIYDSGVPFRLFDPRLFAINFWELRIFRISTCSWDVNTDAPRKRAGTNVLKESHRNLLSVATSTNSDAKCMGSPSSGPFEEAK